MSLRRRRPGPARGSRPVRPGHDGARGDDDQRGAHGDGRGDAERQHERGHDDEAAVHPEQTGEAPVTEPPSTRPAAPDSCTGPRCRARHRHGAPGDRRSPGPSWRRRGCGRRAQPLGLIGGAHPRAADRHDHGSGLRTRRELALAHGPAGDVDRPGYVAASPFVVLTDVEQGGAAPHRTAPACASWGRALGRRCGASRRPPSPRPRPAGHHGTVRRVRLKTSMPGP